jgi:hypothetical protein
VKSLVPLIPRLLAKRIVPKPSQGQPLKLSLTANREPVLSSGGPERVYPQQPQVRESIAGQISVGAGQPGIPC